MIYRLWLRFVQSTVDWFFDQMDLRESARIKRQKGA